MWLQIKQSLFFTDLRNGNQRTLLIAKDVTTNHRPVVSPIVTRSCTPRIPTLCNYIFGRLLVFLSAVQLYVVCGSAVEAPVSTQRLAALISTWGASQGVRSVP